MQGEFELSLFSSFLLVETPPRGSNESARGDMYSWRKYQKQEKEMREPKGPKSQTPRGAGQLEVIKETGQGEFEFLSF